jgi:hypothetical protein
MLIVKRYLQAIQRQAGFLFVFFFISLVLHAQQQEEQPSLPDTLVPLNSPPPAVYDTDTANEDEDEEIQQVETDLEIFIPRDRQISGGGPDSLSPIRISNAEIKKLKEDDAFWYVNQAFEKEVKEEPASSSFMASPLFQTILWLLIIGVFIAVLGMYLSNSNVRLFRKNRTIASAETDEETEDIFAINYRKEIDKAVSARNYRFAVRLQFLQLLRTLADKNIIRYKHDLTNFDYLLQMNSSAWYADFSRLTRSYEYSWYGLFDIDETKYAVIRDDFESFDRKLN